MYENEKKIGLVNQRRSSLFECVQIRKANVCKKYKKKSVLGFNNFRTGFGDLASVSMNSPSINHIVYVYNFFPYILFP